MKKLFKLAAVAAALTFGANVVNANDKIGFVDPNFLMQNHPFAIEAEQKFEKFVKENQSKFEAENKALEAEEKKLIAENNRLTEKRKSLDAEFKKFAADAEKFEKDSVALDSAVKAKMAELDKNTRLSTKQKQAELEKTIGKRGKDLQNRGAALQKRQNDLNAKAKPFESEGAAFQKKAEAFEQKRKAFQDRVNKANKEVNGFEPQEVQQKVIESINETIKKVAKEKGYTMVFPMAVAPVYVADESVDITEEVLVAMGGKIEKPKAENEVKAADAKAEEVKTEAKEEAKSETKPEEAKQ